MNRTVYDTISETKGDRMSVYKEGGTTYVPYSNGAECVWEKTADGDGTRLKEVRTLVRAHGPRKHFVGAGFGPGMWKKGTTNG